MKHVRYELPPERVLLGEVDLASKRQRARTTCASSAGRFAWLRLDVCATRRGAPGTKVEQVASSADVVAICREFAERYMNLQEFFGVLCLDAKQRPIGFAVVAVGGMSSTNVDPRIVFKPALLAPAAALVVTHNHPSGDVNPSHDDIALTKRLVEASRILGMQLLDHVIVAEDKSYSFLDHGLMA